MTAQEKIDDARDRANGKSGVGASAKSLLALIDQQKGEIARALPKHMDADRMIRIAWSTIKGNKKLLSCSPISVLNGVMEAAALGLEIDGVLGQGYLVPYQKGSALHAQFQLGYKGMIVLAHRSGFVKACAAEVVHENDAFDYCEGTESYLRHRRALRDRGDPICAWAACISAGEPTFRILDFDDIQRAKASSKGAKREDSPWETHPSEMWCKTALRALLKRQPFSSEIHRPIAIDEERERTDAFVAPMLTQGSASAADLLGLDDERETVEAPASNEKAAS
jgi:recombination protein RecT